MESKGVIELPNNLEKDFKKVAQLNTSMTGYFELPRVQMIIEDIDNHFMDIQIESFNMTDEQYELLNNIKIAGEAY